MECKFDDRFHFAFLNQLKIASRLVVSCSRLKFLIDSHNCTRIYPTFCEFLVTKEFANQSKFPVSLCHFHLQSIQ